MKKLSRLFTKFVLIVAALTLAIGQTTPAFARGGVSNKGGGSYSYDYWYGYYHYVGSVSWTWHSILNKSNTVYNWESSGQYAIYDFKGDLVDSGNWSGKSHEVLKDGQLKVYNGSSRGKYQNHTYKYQVTVANGELKMSHYWFDGHKVF